MPSPSPDYDVYAHYAFYLLQKIDEGIATKLPSTPNIPRLPDELQPTGEQGGISAKRRERISGPTPEKPVGILGAGVCGLYTAMILEDLGIPYRILEAKRKVGGRLFTYNFPNSYGAPYNYFDIGAMRFPKTPAMNRVFNLFANPNLNTPDIKLNDRLRPFYFFGQGDDKPFLYYNDVRARNTGSLPENIFKASDVLQNRDKEAYIRAGTSAIVDDVIRPYASALLDDLKNNTRTGWDKLLSVDEYSLRAYMSFKYQPSKELGIPDKPLPTDVVNWCETFDKSTGWYDRAFSETVLEAIAFGWTPEDPQGKKTDWYLIDEGSEKIAAAMETYINKQNPNAIIFDERVSAIKVTNRDTVTVTANRKDQDFAHVVTTIPLPVMRTVDLTKAKLSPMQSNALRDLNYGDSVKIGVQFRTAWWTTGKDLDGKKLGIIGGQTYTDRPLRTVVYPSFGSVHDAKTTTLIASYCWTEDASRLGALVGHDDAYLAQVILKELADIHNVDIEFLRNELVDIKGWSWAHDPYTMGAFAFFGPGKFKAVYESLNAPAGDGLIHFANEALSVRHAWVEGALDSAWRAVAELLTNPGFTRAQRDKFQKNWGKNPEWIPKRPSRLPGGAQGKAPVEVDLFSSEGSFLKHLAFTEAYKAIATEAVVADVALTGVAAANTVAAGAAVAGVAVAEAGLNAGLSALRLG